jgi:membrane-anchored glycerophosphoryl diester phosphodiesterase (GDPDase)
VTEPEPRRPRAPIDLHRQRDLGELLADGVRIYGQEFRTFFLIALAVVVPVNLIVSGIGLGQITGEYDSTPEPGESVIQLVSSLLLIMPLVSAMSIYALLDLADGRKPRARDAIQRGLDVFAPLLAVTVMYAVGVAAGLFLLIVPGVYLFVRWVFFVPATVVDGRRGFEALERSAEAVSGSWFRVLLVTLALNILAGGASGLVASPFLAAADSTGDAVYQLIGTMFGGVLFAAPFALIMTLFYFDRRARKGIDA